MRIYQPHIKIADTPEIKPGTVLISQGFWNNEEFQRSVILILEHNDDGSSGIILNKLSNLSVIQALPALPVSDPLFYGGPVNTSKIGFIHQCKNISGVIKIAENLFWGGNIYELKNLIESGELPSNEIKFYAGLVEWMPGELSYEIHNKNWWTDHFDFNELIENNSYNLWTYKLMQQENLYGLLHNVPDPILN